MFSILGWIVFGLIVGALAKLVMPGRDPGGIMAPSVGKRAAVYALEPSNSGHGHRCASVGSAGTHCGSIY
jgi:hypothetical protein